MNRSLWSGSLIATTTLVALIGWGPGGFGHAQQPGQSRAGEPPPDLRAHRLQYEAGAKSDWHTHERGQLLFAEKGRGQTQKRSQEVRVLGAGDYDYTPPNVEHWHGAAADFPYLEVQVNWLTSAQQSASPRPPIELQHVIGRSPQILDASDLQLSYQRREPGNRSNWHLHEIAQLLFIQEGKARIQHRGWPMREYTAGQADYTEGVEHWQGAAPDSFVLFVQVSWGGTTQQYEQPTEAEYLLWQGNQQEQIGMQLPAAQTLPSKNILMLVGAEGGSTPGNSIGDVFIRNRLELDMGHKVTNMAGTEPADKMLAAANSADLVILAESVGSAQVQSKLVPTATPILSYENFLQDEFQLVNPQGPEMDPGLPSYRDDSGVIGHVEKPTMKGPLLAYGTTADQTHINIVNPKHPLAAGLNGRVQVYRFPREMNWGQDTTPSAEVIATLPDHPNAKVIYVVRRGAALYDRTPAAGLRVHFFLENDNATGTANLMTMNGLRLFDAAVNYALTTDPKP